MSTMRVAYYGLDSWLFSLDNARGTRVKQVVSSFQEILRGSQLSRYMTNHQHEMKNYPGETQASGKLLQLFNLPCKNLD